MQYDPEGDFIHDVTEVKSIVTEMAEDLLAQAEHDINSQCILISKDKI